MMPYVMLDSDKLVLDQIGRWHERKVKSVAVDFEGEFNLHIYGEHLCLIQLFDGSDYYLIDPFAVSQHTLKILLEDDDLEKVMFDCASDAALVRKQYGITLKPVYDVRIAAKLLGFDGNLVKLIERCLGIPVPTGKKGNQMANWLRRPLSEKLIAYALSDVQHLFDLRKVLERELAEAQLEQKNRTLQGSAALPKGPDKPGWEKLPGFRYLSNSEKVYVQRFFEARDQLARRLNRPAFQVLDKRALIAMAKDVPKSKDDVLHVLTQHNARVDTQLVTLLLAARDKAIDELRE